MFGPPQFFPPVPINIPGNQGLVTFVPGLPVFEPAQIAAALSTHLGTPIGLPTVFVPPVTFDQQD